MLLPFEPRQILVATDYSEAAGAALDLAVSLARDFKARITILHANGMCPPPQTLVFRGRLTQAFRETASDLAEQLATHAAEHGCLPSRRIVVNDNPAPAILQAIEDIQADLVIMGTHGKSGFKKFMIGSVAEEVLHKSKVPVLTVREKAFGLQRIVCPLDHSSISRKSLEVALRVAQQLSSELLVLRTIEEAIGSGSPLDSNRCDGASLSVEERALPAGRNVAELITRYAQEKAAGLIVIGCRPGRAYEVVRRAHCPVLTISSRCTIAEEPLITEQELRECLRI